MRDEQGCPEAAIMALKDTPVQVRCFVKDEGIVIDCLVVCAKIRFRSWRCKSVS